MHLPYMTLERLQAEIAQLTSVLKPYDDHPHMVVGRTESKLVAYLRRQLDQYQHELNNRLDAGEQLRPSTLVPKTTPKASPKKHIDGPSIGF